MSKRESGWYRIYINECDLWGIFYFDGVNWWYGESVITETTIADCDFDVYEMVMNKVGLIIYNQPEHDPLYNTQQEG